MTQVVLTIAGTDPSGAAGIQADLQVIRDHGHHGVSVITAVLAQNSSGVRVVQPLAAGLVEAQLDTVFDDFDIAAVKVGLVPNDELVRMIAARLEDLPVVWDPVMRSGDGATELFGGSPAALLSALSRVAVVTPNVGELEQLMGTTLTTRQDAHEAARSLAAHVGAVLLKVGHLPHSGDLSDIWAHAGESFDLAALPAVSHDVRGTGCQLSSAIACRLADGVEPLDAVEGARRYLNALLLRQAVHLGKGRAIIVR